MKKIVFLLLFTAVVLTQTSVFAAYIDNGDGTVTDNLTGLMWQKCSMGQTNNSDSGACDGSASQFNWQNAMNQSEALTLAGHSDWRLPNHNELQSIVDHSTYYPAIDSSAFPNTVSSRYWSSTTCVNNQNCAWYVYFDNGYVYNNYKSRSYYVCAVRAGQSTGPFDHSIISAAPTTP